MRGDGGNHHEKLGLKRMPCASQFTIPDTAGTNPDPACNYTHTSSSQPNQAIRTPDFSYPLVSSTSFSSSSPISLFLVNNSNIITEHKLQLSLSISPCHDHELTLSTAYTEYNIHLVLAMGPGNPPAVWDWTGKTVLFGPRPIQSPDPELLGGLNLYLYPSTRGFCRVWLDPSVPISSSRFRVFLFMVAVRYVTVMCKISTLVHDSLYLFYWLPL